MHSNRLSYIITLTINVVHEHTKRSVSVGAARCLHIQGYGSSLISSARSKSRAHIQVQVEHAAPLPRKWATVTIKIRVHPKYFFLLLKVHEMLSDSQVAYK